MVQALRQLQRDGHLPTDASTRLHFSRDELSTYLESEDGQSRAARTRPQWAKLLEAPTLLVVACVGIKILRAMPVPHRSAEPARPRHRREMT